MRVTSFAVAAVAAAILLSTSAQSRAASDNAGNAAYADGWQDGDNGGSGFGPWSSGFSGSSALLAFPTPKFIDTTPLAFDSLGAPSFALTTSNQAYYYDTSEVTRSLTTPFAVGQTFSADVDGPALSPTPDSFGFDYGVGATFQFCSNGACGSGSVNERFGLFSNYFYNPNWTTKGGADTGIASENAFHFEFTLLPGDTYNLNITPVGGGAPLFSQAGAALSGPAGSAIDNIRITVYGTGSTADGSTELFFDNLSIAVPEPSSLAMMFVAGLGLAASARRRQ